MLLRRVDIVVLYFCEDSKHTYLKILLRLLHYFHLIGMKSSPNYWFCFAHFLALLSLCCFGNFSLQSCFENLSLPSLLCPSALIYSHSLFSLFSFLLHLFYSFPLLYTYCSLVIYLLLLSLFFFLPISFFPYTYTLHLV